MKNQRQIVFVLILALGLFFGKKIFFPSNETQIRKNLNELAEFVSKKKNENIIQVANKISQAIEYFEPPVELEITYQNTLNRVLTAETKERVKEYLTSTKFRYPWVLVSFEEIKVDVQNSIATTAGVARLEFETVEQGQVYDLFDILLSWKKIEGNWKITQVSISHIENAD